MNLENNIKDMISAKLEDGTIEKLVSEQLETGIKKALDSLFGSYGDVTKVIEKEIKSVMVPYLESYDYSEYVTKLDSVLVEVLKSTSLENKNMLENFKTLMNTETNMKSIKVSEIFAKWCKHVSEEVDTDGLDIDYDDGARYNTVEVTYEFEEDCNGRDWLNKETGKILFECEHDEKMNFCIEVYRWSDIHKKNQWNFRYDKKLDLSSLRYLNEFEVFLMNLNQLGVNIEIDVTGDSEDITPDKEPEVSYS